MKKVKWLLLVLLIVAMAFVGAYFHVDGAEIPGVKEIDKSCEVTISRYNHLFYEERTEHILDENGVSALKNLLMDSDFLRTNASYVQFDSDDLFYDIRIIWDDDRDPLRITSIGDEAISVVNQFGGHHLLIQNDKWLVTLESIIAQ